MPVPLIRPAKSLNARADSLLVNTPVAFSLHHGLPESLGSAARKVSWPSPRKACQERRLRDAIYINKLVQESRELGRQLAETPKGTGRPLAACPTRPLEARMGADPGVVRILIAASVPTTSQSFILLLTPNQVSASRDTTVILLNQNHNSSQNELGLTIWSSSKIPNGFTNG